MGPNPSVDTHTAWRYVGQGAERCGQSWETLVCRWIEDKGELHTSPAACRKGATYRPQAWLEWRPTRWGTLFCLAQT